jgi:hypothetical protein
VQYTVTDLPIPLLPDIFVCIYLNKLYHIVAILIPIILLRRKSHVGILTIEDCLFIELWTF